MAVHHGRCNGLFVSVYDAITQDAVAWYHAAVKGTDIDNPAFHSVYERTIADCNEALA